MLVAFDRPEPTFRHDADETYKANREAAPDILRQQMGLVREVLDALGVATCELAGWEADDLIATAVDQAVARGDDVVIVTGDRDTYQLVADPHVKVLYNRRGVSDYALYDEAGIEERTGVTPDAVPRVRGAPRRPQRQPPGRAGRGGEDGGQADHDVRRPRRDLRQHLDDLTPKLAGLAGRARGARAQEPRGHGAAPRRADRAARVAEDARPTCDEVQRLFDFLEFRTFADRLADALGPAAVVLAADEREHLVAEVTHSESPAAERGAADVARRRSTSPPRGTASRAGARSRGLAVVTDAGSAAVTWIPGDHLADAGVVEALQSTTGPGPRRQVR